MMVRLMFTKNMGWLLCFFAVMGSILSFLSCARSKGGVPHKVIVLGFDGMDPRLVEDMMAQGRLPHFQGLKERGMYRRLETTNPPQSPVAWAAIATGKNPGKTGVFDFLVRNPETYQITLALSQKDWLGRPLRPIKTTCFWQHASNAGIPVCILNAPLSYPPDRVNGTMLSGMGIPDILGTQGTFTFYTTENIPEDHDVGGTVITITRAAAINLELPGPRVFGASDRLKMPFTLLLKENQQGVGICYQGRCVDLKEGEWTDWQRVVFGASPWQKLRGICRFYLVEASPEIKLYVSPVNFDPQHPLFPISYPAGYSKKLAGAVGLYSTLGMPMDTWAVNENRISEQDFLHQMDQVFQEKKKLLDLELDRFSDGIFFMYFEFTDIIQHMFWRHMDPQHPRYDDKAAPEDKDMIYRWYEKMDAVLGSVMRKMNGNDTLIVLSDHGFSSFRRAVHLNSWLRKNGYLELKDSQKKSGQALLSDIDWSRTRAYATGFGAVYVNQKGREREGVVPSGDAAEEIKTEIARELEAWRDPSGDKPVIKRVYRGEKIFKGSYVKNAPDLYVGFNEGYRASWQTAIGGVPEALIEDNLKAWSGDHLVDPTLVPGIILINRKSSVQAPAVEDIAPTILDAAGVSAERIMAADFDGNSLFSGDAARARMPDVRP